MTETLTPVEADLLDALEQAKWFIQDHHGDDDKAALFCSTVLSPAISRAASIRAKALLNPPIKF
jgi:hypothetical protein